MAFVSFVPEVFRLSRRQTDYLEKAWSIRKSLDAQKKDKECFPTTENFFMLNRKFTVDEHGRLVLILLFDGGVQRYVPRSVLPRFNPSVTL